MNFPCKQRRFGVGCVRPNKQCKNEQQHFALASTAVYLETGNFMARQSLRCARIGRAESVLATAYQCQRWDVSNHALSHFVLDGSCAAQRTAMKHISRKNQIHNRNSLDDFDKALDCWEKIIVITKLIRACSETEWLDSQIVAHAGDLILLEANNLYDLLRKLEYDRLRQ